MMKNEPGDGQEVRRMYTGKAITPDGKTIEFGGTLEECVLYADVLRKQYGSGITINIREKQ